MKPNANKLFPKKELMAFEKEIDLNADGEVDLDAFRNMMRQSLKMAPLKMTKNQSSRPKK